MRQDSFLIHPLPPKHFQLIQEVMRPASQLDFIINYAIKLLDKCEPSPYFPYLSRIQETAAKSGPRKPCVLPACGMHQGCGAAVCTKPEQLIKYFQIGACPLLLLGRLPPSHERAQASVLKHVVQPAASTYQGATAQQDSMRSTC